MSALIKTSDIEEFISANYHVIDEKILTLSSAIFLCEKDDEKQFLAITEMSQYVFDQNTKASRNCLISMFYVDSFDFVMLHLVRILQKNIGMDINHIYQLVKERSVTAFTDDVVNGVIFSIKDITLITKAYPKTRWMKLFSSHLGLVKDTASMMVTIGDEMPSLNYLPKKPKSLDDVHFACLRTLPKISQENFSLAQREDVLALDGKVLMGDLMVRVPNCHYDLVDLGESLNFCIGNGDYSRAVANGTSSIVAVFDKNGPRYGVQFSRYRVLQAHGLSNLPANKPTGEVLKALQEMLTCEPTLPSDFLPIIDSGWVKGYKYNDKDLYLLLNGVVYIYFDVPIDVYEELLISDRKGRFVNTIIKGEFQYERLGEIE